MKFLTYKASDNNYRSYSEINSIEELVRFIEENGGDIILGTVYDPEDDSFKMGITIFDDYIY